MKATEAESWIKGQLVNEYGEGESLAMARMVLEHLTGLRKEARVDGGTALSGEQQQEMESIVRRLQAHEPIQYILERAWFYGLPFYVDRSVLIPRPETEELVDWIVRDCRAMGYDVFEATPLKADETRMLKILDVGTGSGCIPLSLKKAMPRAEVWGCDISDEALNVARRNGSLLDIRVDFQSVDFLDEGQQKGLPTADIVVSNPPYVPLRDKAAMHPNVVGYEPHTALFVPDNDALVFYRALIAFASHRLYPGGKIYMEIHEDLGDAVAGLFQQAGFRSVELRKDMQGKDRMVKAG